MDALGELAKTHYLHITHSGHNVLSVACISFFASALIFTFMSLREAPARREHFYATTLVVLMAALSYYAMSTNHGDYGVHVAGQDVNRQVFYARYIDWAVTTPLLLLDVLMITGASFGTIGWVVAADIGMIGTGLIAALLDEPSRWGWFLFGCIFMVAIFWELLTGSKAALARRDNSLMGLYTSLVVALAVLWTAYPIVWALAEGTNYISVDTEVYLYAFLDITAKIVFGSVILNQNSRLQESYGKGTVGDAEAPLLQEG